MRMASRSCELQAKPWKAEKEVSEAEQDLWHRVRIMSSPVKDSESAVFCASWLFHGHVCHQDEAMVLA